MNKFWNFTDNDDGSRTLMLCGSIADESWYDDDITPKAFREELNALGVMLLFGSTAPVATVWLLPKSTIC